VATAQRTIAAMTAGPAAPPVAAVTSRPAASETACEA
jgi:hypothetical protein